MTNNHKNNAIFIICGYYVYTALSFSVLLTTGRETNTQRSLTSSEQHQPLCFWLSFSPMHLESVYPYLFCLRLLSY